MPSFYRKTTGSTTRASTPRRFIVRKPVDMSKKRTTSRKTKALSDVVAKPQPNSPLTVLNNTTPQESGELKNSYVTDKAESTLQSLDELLKTPPDNTGKNEAVNPDENAVYREDENVAAFNGVSDAHEQRELDTEIIDFERRKAEVMEEQLRLTEKEHDAEKKALEKQIRELKQELHRTAPIQDNKFFTLSKQLREAIVEIERIASEKGIPLDHQVPPVPVVPPTIAAPPVPATQPVTLKEPVPTPQIPKTVTASPPPLADTSVTAEKKTLTKKKVLITGASAVALLLLVSGGVSHMANKPKVDQKIVNQYLNNQSGKVQGIQTSAAGVNSGQITANDPSQADVSFEQSVWENFNDSGFGILLQYPKNAVKPVKTDSNVTFIRKTGYLFKVQRIETALTLDEYWKQIKATSLNYSVSQDKFKGKTALKLELTDMADYPGDRYLVKEGKYIYDVWYATASNNFPKDDIQRAQKMLDSLSIVGGKE